jgi:hypothetical protein
LNTKQKNASSDIKETLTVQELQAMNPLDIAIDYAQSKGIEFTEEMQDMFKEVLAQVAREEM